MQRPASEPGLPENPAPPELFSPGSTPAPESEHSYDWPYLAAFSIIIPLLIGLLAILPAAAGLAGAAFAPVWVMLFTMVGVGFISGIVPLVVARQGREWVRQSATMGITLNCFCLVWLFGAVAIARSVAYSDSPAGKAERAAQQRAEQIERQYEQRMARNRLEKQRELAEIAAQQEALGAEGRAWEEQQQTRAFRLAQRFQYGDKAGPVPPPDQASSKPQVIKRQPLEIVKRTYAATTSNRSLALPSQSGEGYTLQPLEVTFDKFFSEVVVTYSGIHFVVYLLQRDGQLLEVSSKTWTVQRELDLGGPCASIGFNHAMLSGDPPYLLIGRSEPGALLKIQHGHMRVSKEIPVANLRYAASEQEFCRVLTGTKDCELALVHLPSNELVHLISRETAQAVGAWDKPAREEAFDGPDSSANSQAANLVNWFHLLERMRATEGERAWEISTGAGPGFISPAGQLRWREFRTDPYQRYLAFKDGDKTLKLRRVWVLDKRQALVADEERMYAVTIELGETTN
jgi:hypothetical protein